MYKHGSDKEDWILALTPAVRTCRKYEVLCHPHSRYETETKHRLFLAPDSGVQRECEVVTAARRAGLSREDTVDSHGASNVTDN